MRAAPRRAMLLAAGLGTRMRPITDTLPKPLVRIAGRTMLDRGLDALQRAGVDEVVVNVHHLADQIVAHLAGRAAPRTIVSDEREALLDSAGGIVAALSLLGPDPFYLVNADTFWIDAGRDNLAELALAWDAARMDILLMLASPENATGHGARTDFLVDGQGRLARNPSQQPGGLIYAGAAIVDPGIFAGAQAEPHSLNLYFDRAIAAGRLFGMVMSGHWITVGTPDAIAPAEEAVAHAGAA